VRVTAWASPLPLDEAPYQAADANVIRFVRERTQESATREPVTWLPLDSHVGLAYVAPEVFVVSLPEPGEGSAVQGYRLAESAHLSVTPRGPMTRLELGALTLTVGSKTARAALQLLGLSRLSRPYSKALSPVSHWHVAASEWTTAMFGAHVGSSEIVLAFEPLSLAVPLSSRWLGELAIPTYLLVTPERITIIGAAVTGEVYLPSIAGAPGPWLNGETVDPSSFRCLGKNVFQLNEHRFKGSTKLAEIARCFEKVKDDRILVAAQALSGGARSSADRQLALAWLKRLTPGSVGSAPRLAEWCLSHQLDQPKDGLAPWTLDEHAPNLVDVWQSYGFDETLGAWLMDELHGAPQAWKGAAVELSEMLWRLRRDRADDQFELARLDLTHAGFAFRLGFPERARAVLAETPRLFPPPTLADIYLPSFSGVSPWRELRRETELTMRQITGADPRQQDLARQRLIALDPLNTEWLHEAAQSKLLGARAQLALELLEGPITREPAEYDVPRSQLRPLEGERIESQLRHPLTRGKNTVASKLADAIAIVPTPDEAVLKLYCERVTKSDSPVLDALDRAATVLGLGHFELYVSRGKDDVGAQAYAAQSKVMLVGGQHTDPGSRHYLEPLELSFAFAAELAHVRFGHSRVSGADVVRGLLSKGKQGAEIAFSLLPLISGINLGKRLGVVTAKLSLPRINKAITAARTIESAVNSALPPERLHADLGRPTEALLDAHRVEQLSADRAGLVCCGNLLSAFVAILKTRTDYVRVNATLRTNGALAAITQHAPSSTVAFDDLKLRLGSLIAFYLSDDYEELRRLTYHSVPTSHIKTAQALVGP
jgi:hypothetical protein